MAYVTDTSKLIFSSKQKFKRSGKNHDCPKKHAKQKGTASQLITSEKGGQGKRKMKVIIFVSQRLKTKKCISFLCELWEKPPIFTPLTNPKIIVIRHERESLQFFSSHLFVTSITKICVIFIYQKCYNFFV